MKRFPSFRICVIAAWMAGTGLLISGSAEAVTPMMDADQFKDSRLLSSNLAKDGYFPEAVKVEEKAYLIAQAQLGPLHPSLAPVIKDLGLLYHTLGNFKKAEEEYKWGLALVEKNMGLNSPASAVFLDGLASLYMDLNRLTEAELSANQSLAIRKAGRGDKETLIQTLNLLGSIESKLQKNDRARLFLNQALTLKEKESPSDPGAVICLLRDLAQIDLSEKKFSAAQSGLERALSLAQKTFPADSAEIADAMISLADFFHFQGQGDKAQALHQSALPIARHFVGAVYNYASLPHLRRLAKVEFVTGDLKGAEFLWEKSIQVEKKVFGSSHPKVALDLIHLADVERTLGQKAKEQKLLKEALGLLKNCFPDDHPLVLLAQKHLK